MLWLDLQAETSRFVGIADLVRSVLQVSVC